MDVNVENGDVNGGHNYINSHNIFQHIGLK